MKQYNKSKISLFDTSRMRESNNDSGLDTIKSESEESSDNPSVEELLHELENEKNKSLEYEAKFKRALADFQNLERRTKSDIEQNVNKKLDEFLKDLLQFIDDLERAKSSLAQTGVDVSGLISIIKNMSSFLQKNNVTPIDSLGEIFNPNLHEALSVIEDSSLDDGTITKEIRKGYICQNRVIRPALVEVSKKSE